jgi:hypothetical protein
LFDTVPVDTGRFGRQLVDKGDSNTITHSSFYGWPWILVIDQGYNLRRRVVWRVAVVSVGDHGNLSKPVASSTGKARIAGAGEK